MSLLKFDVKDTKFLFWYNFRTAIRILQFIHIFILSRCLLVPGWKPRGTYKISIVCVSGVCATRIISETAPRIFPKPGMKLGVKNVRNVAQPLFQVFARFLENRSFVRKKKPWQFLGLCRKSVPRIFLKFCLNVLTNSSKDGTAVSPWKWDISEILGEVI